MNDFLTTRLGKPYEDQKRILIVAKDYRQAEDYRRTLTPEQGKLARYVDGPSSIRGARRDEWECHKIGPYWERRDSGEIEADINERGIESKEIYEWR